MAENRAQNLDFATFHPGAPEIVASASGISDLESAALASGISKLEIQDDFDALFATAKMKNEKVTGLRLQIADCNEIITKLQGLMALAKGERRFQTIWKEHENEWEEKLQTLTAQLLKAEKELYHIKTEFADAITTCQQKLDAIG